MVLIRDVVTRWNSLMAAMKRFLKLKAALKIFWTKFCKEYEFSEAEWTMLEEFCKIEPLYNAIVELCSEKNTSVSKVIPMVYRLKEIYTGNRNLNFKFRLHHHCNLAKGFNVQTDRIHMMK